MKPYRQMRKTAICQQRSEIMAKQEANTSRWKNWVDGLKAEFRKIIWPSRDDIQKETTAVVVVSIILGVIIAILDFIIQNGVDFLVNL